MPLMEKNGTLSTGLHYECEEDRPCTEYPQQEYQAFEERSNIHERGARFTTQRFATKLNETHRQLENLHKIYQHSRLNKTSTTPSMGFSLTPSSDELTLTALTQDNVKMTVVVDSRASDDYMDDKLVIGVRQLMYDYQERDTPGAITTAGLHALLGSGTANVRSDVTDSNGRTRMASLTIKSVPGIGRNLTSPDAAQTKSTTTIISDRVRLEEGDTNFPRRRDGQLFVLDLVLLEKANINFSSTRFPVATNDADTWHRRLGHPNYMKMLKDQLVPWVSFEENVSPCKTGALGKGEEENPPRRQHSPPSHHVSLSIVSLSTPTSPGDSRQMDGSQYISKFAHRQTRCKADYPIRSKDNAIETVS